MEVKTKKLSPNPLGDNNPFYIPTRKQIAAACRLIRESWDATTRRSRLVYVNLALLSELYAYPIYVKDGIRKRSNRKLPDCDLCDSDYWQHAISNERSNNGGI